MPDVLSVTLPVFLVMALGFVCARTHVLGADASKHLSAFVFYCAMPCYLFGAMAAAPVEVLSNMRYMLAFALGLAATGGLSWIVARRVCGLGPSASVLAVMAGSYTNSAFVGIPIVAMAFGDPSPVIVAALFQIIVVTTAILTALDALTRNGKLSLRDVLSVPRTALVNPIVGASLVGAVFALMDWGVPQAIGRSLDLLGKAGIPTALFALGLSLGGTDARPERGRGPLIVGLALMKTVAHPALAWCVGSALGLTGAWLGALVVVSAMPTAMNTFVFAQRHETFAPEAARIVFLSSVVSFFTLSALLWVFMSAGQ